MAKSRDSIPAAECAGVVVGEHLAYLCPALAAEGISATPLTCSQPAEACEQAAFVICDHRDLDRLTARWDLVTPLIVLIPEAHRELIAGSLETKASFAAVQADSARGTAERLQVAIEGGVYSAPNSRFAQEGQ